MTRQPVQSSDVVSIGFDDELSMMEIEFHTGSIYLYHDVPRDFYMELATAPSIGEFVNRVLKRAGFAYERVK